MTSCCNSDFVLYLLHILDNDFFLYIILLASIQPSYQQSHLNYLTFFSLACEIFQIHFDSLVLMLLCIYISLFTLYAIYDVGIWQFISQGTVTKLMCF